MWVGCDQVSTRIKENLKMLLPHQKKKIINAFSKVKCKKKYEFPSIIGCYS